MTSTKGSFLRRGAAARWGVILLLGACSAAPAAVDAGVDGGLLDGGVHGCDPGANPDPCMSAGEACMPDYSLRSTTGYLCQSPGPFFNCVPEVGCGASDLACVDAGAPAPWVCLQTCATTAECADPLTICAPLAPGGESGGARYCLLNECGDFWQPCAAESGDAGDGTCVFIEVDPTLGPVGACLQAGAAPLNASCAYYRDAGGAACAGGTVCMISDGRAQTGECMALCDVAVDGGPACAGTCVRAIPPAPPPPISAFDFFTPTGGCASSCDASGGCPSGYSCYQLGAANERLCLP